MVDKKTQKIKISYYSKEQTDTCRSECRRNLFTENRNLRMKRQFKIYNIKIYDIKIFNIKIYDIKVYNIKIFDVNIRTRQ